jgi:hypothetical protein
MLCSSLFLLLVLLWDDSYELDPLVVIQSYSKSVSPQIFLHAHVSQSGRQECAYDLTQFVLMREQAS